MEQLHMIMNEAFKLKASDIYFLPKDFGYEIGYFFNGTYHKRREISKEVGRQLLNYLKFQANMTLSEHRRAQLGSWTYLNDNQKIFCRLSSVGDFLSRESLVLRLIYQQDNLESNYFFEEEEQLIVEEMKKRGLILFAGPMGSGKTSSMYSFSKRLTKSQVMTIEDPVEIYEPKFLQLQVNDKAEMTYSDLLKVALRHHPEIFIIGEIRDSKTAKIAINAALSGHLVFSTVHAQSACGVVQRLKNLGISIHELQQTLRIISYQRLILDTENKIKVLCDQIVGSKIDYEKLQNKMTLQWEKKLEYCYKKGWITKESKEKYFYG